MQVQVVDDCSTDDDPERVVEEFGRSRVEFHRKVKNEGATRTFNTCIQQSVGHLVHILHGDDGVVDGYYEYISKLAKRYPDLGLYAARSFLVNEQSIIIGVTGRICELEQPGNTVTPFFYTTPIQFAGVTVRRCSYETLGGFRTDLVHMAVIAKCGRVLLVHVAV